MAKTRTPLKDKPLRNPGQSVRQQRLDLAHDKLLAPALFAFLAIYVAGLDWVRYFFPAKSEPWLATLFAVGAIAYAIWRFVKYWPKVQALRLAEDGEKAVGQYLEGLRSDGYAVFHDLIDDDFNVDHVIIGPAGVFTIETKTWSKPAKGSPHIDFDGETVSMAGLQPDRNPVIQAKAQASWLKRILEESTGMKYPVRPVVLFPGWFIKDIRARRNDLWVLEPKALSAFLANEKPQLPPEDISLAASHLSRFIRANERRLEAAA